jgi:fatty acid desaturase
MTALTTNPVDRQASDYGTLLAEVRRARLLDRSGLSYLPRGLAIGGMMIVGLAAFWWLGDSWWQLAVAAFFAVVFAQLGFLGHDAGHQQIFRSKRRNDVLGLLLSNLGVGLSYEWWVDKHNRHHRHPNEVGSDPDVQRNILAWTPDQADSQRGAFRVVARHQAAFFFPLLLLEGWNLHVAAAQSALRGEVPAPRLEVGLLVAHVLGYLTAVFWVLTPLQAIVFIAVHQGLWGLYMGLAFAPNHKGMPMIAAGSRLDHLHKQVLTSRNVRGGRITDYALGGLNYQIEHHLFPKMPRPNLRHAQSVVRAYCDAHDLGYTQTSAMRSYTQVLAHLHEVGAALRVPGRRSSAAH